MCANPCGLLDTSYTRPERNVDVLIADIDIPGMKGTDLAQQATERRPHLRVLLVSGGAADTRGATVLQKPSIRKS
jgi:DNA-binding NtrC family response regulator